MICRLVRKGAVLPIPLHSSCVGKVGVWLFRYIGGRRIEAFGPGEQSIFNFPLFFSVAREKFAGEACVLCVCMRAFQAMDLTSSVMSQAIPCFLKLPSLLLAMYEGFSIAFPYSRARGRLRLPLECPEQMVHESRRFHSRVQAQGSAGLSGLS